jgi:hypothetical protein
MSYIWLAILIALGLFVSMLVMIVLGRRIGRSRLTRDPDASTAGQGVIDAAVFALLGLLIAFTFSGAATRFDERRQLIVQEANDIGTAWLRLDLLPDAAQPELRQAFRDYLDARIAATRLMPDVTAAMGAYQRSKALQGDIWAKAVATTTGAGSTVGPGIPGLVLPALNAMFDITTSRTMAAQRHPPLAIWIMFYAVAMVVALLAGHGMAASTTPSVVHLIGFPLIVAMVVSLVINLEHPRLGLISFDSFDQALIELRTEMQ